MIEPGPPFTIVARGRDVQGRHWVQVRKRGGQQTRVVIPDIFVDEATIQETAAIVAAMTPEPPGPNAY